MNITLIYHNRIYVKLKVQGKMDGLSSPATMSFVTNSWYLLATLIVGKKLNTTVKWRVDIWHLYMIMRKTTFLW